MSTATPAPLKGMVMFVLHAAVVLADAEVNVGLLRLALRKAAEVIS